MNFDVLETREAMQTARMRLEPGEQSGPMGNEHAKSEQVLVVISGTVEAHVGDRVVTLRQGESAMVKRGEAHQFVNRGEVAAETFNVYTPPAY